MCPNGSVGTHFRPLPFPYLFNCLIFGLFPLFLSLFLLLSLSLDVSSTYLEGRPERKEKEPLSAPPLPEISKVSWIAVALFLGLISTTE